MTLVLELTPAQEARLRKKAAEAGQEPAGYLLRLADIDEEQQDPEESAEGEAGSAYDLFKDLLGGWGSGGANLSEDTGRKFAEGMAGKRDQGTL